MRGLRYRIFCRCIRSVSCNRISSSSISVNVVSIDFIESSELESESVVDHEEEEELVHAKVVLKHCLVIEQSFNQSISEL